MATASVTNNFANGATSDADAVDQNFTDLVNFANTNVVHKDGSVAMTGALTLPGSPSTALQAASKGYVDGLVPAATSTWTPVVRQGATTFTTTLVYGKYLRTGPKIDCQALMQITAGSGVAGELPDITLPVNHVALTGDVLAGGMRLVDGSGTNRTIGSLNLTAADNARGFYDGSTLLTVPTLTVGWFISVSGVYFVA